MSKKELILKEELLELTYLQYKKSFIDLRVKLEKNYNNNKAIEKNYNNINVCYNYLHKIEMLKKEIENIKNGGITNND